MAMIPKIPSASVKPSLPMKPPATSTTSGKPNTTENWANDQPGVQYGANHRKLTMVTSSEIVKKHGT